ncbi:hypothetical protein TCAL_01751 [Tigriopus californicus]|uniref:AB hydrolase-1 domain-containing protein n=1 Tax=Tigriopus californicus TaxID=6832 RepID=A0A553PKK0_TIGCA|nr:lysophosphatidylserine lipase ABHD12-like [Tigriopus californicus]TRY78203.1 hypothetical protein TCAL_01751 [Tigriopus californicus]
MSGKRRLLGLILLVIASYFGLPLWALITLAVLILIVVFLVIPSIFHWSFTVQRHMIFLPWVKWPKLVDFDHPEEQGLEGTINFYLESEEGIKVGVWHVLPMSMLHQSANQNLEWYQKSLGQGQPVVIYMHGNTGSRARDHRISMYQVLRKLGYHIICFDYRGYADSSPVMPTKRGVIQDGKTVIRYVRNHCGSVPIIIWGHSLGSSVSTHIVSDLSVEGNPPQALILESPFNNIKDEIRAHPMTWIWRKMPMFDWFFTGTLDHSDVGFQSDQCIQHIHVPLLILHAKDDLVIPFHLGKKLYQRAQETRLSHSKPVKMISFEESDGFAHIFIHTSPEVPKLVSEFIKDSLHL